MITINAIPPHYRVFVLCILRNEHSSGPRAVHQAIFFFPKSDVNLLITNFAQNRNFCLSKTYLIFKRG